MSLSEQTIAPEDLARAAADQGLDPGEDASALSHLAQDSDIAACLVPLLTVMGWRGDPRHIAEALPHFHKVDDITRLRSVLANLDFVSHWQKIDLRDLDPRLVPCLFLPQSRPALVVLRREGDVFTVFDGLASEIVELRAGDLQGIAYFIRPDEGTGETLKGAARLGQWTVKLRERFVGLVWQMLGITLLTNLLALAVPLFIMAIYDQVIGSGSTEALGYLFGGVVLALGIDFGLRVIRSQVLAYAAGRIDMIVGTATFQQILHLSVSVTGRASMGAQIARLRQFESIREFFSGPLAGVFLDLPLALLFVGVIAIIAGPLAWVPIALAVAFILVGLPVLPRLRKAVKDSSDARAQRESFLVEMLTALRTIKLSAAEPVWASRHREISATAAVANFKTQQITNLIQTLAQTLMMAGGIATLALGAVLVMDKAITVGALIASMALVWRVLSPLQMAFLSFTRIEQVKQALQQIDRLMQQSREREPGCIVERHRVFDGEIRFDRTSLRYLARAEPAVFAVNAAFKPGQLIAITGSNGSGKSTLLKLIAGLYEAQSGAVFLDGIDVRQLDVAELRGATAYVPQKCDLFHGTIAQNLRLANPVASDAALAQAALDAGLMQDILNLPEGFETRLTDQLQNQLPWGVKQRLMLARAYVKNAPIYLMDEPGNNLDAEGDAMLMRKLQQLKGRATVVVVTHRPSHMRIADQVLFMDGGRLMMAGPPDQLLPQLGMS